MPYFPGSIIKKTDLSGREFLEQCFMGQDGLMMKQIKELTGLNTPAIQNWINRGWLSHPVNKRYDKNQVARILIINMLRQTMSLENVSALLFFVNGVAGDVRDDIICESELYDYVCDILFSPSTDETITDYIDDLVFNFIERKRGDLYRLKTALKIIYMNCKAAKYITHAEQMLAELR